MGVVGNEGHRVVERALRVSHDQHVSQDQDTGHQVAPHRGTSTDSVSSLPLLRFADKISHSESESESGFWELVDEGDEQAPQLVDQATTAAAPAPATTARSRLRHSCWCG